MGRGAKHYIQKYRLGIVLLITVVIVGGVGGFTLHSIATSLRRDIQAHLETKLNADIAALEFWWEHQIGTVDSWASNKRVSENITQLVAAASNEDEASQQSSLDSSELTVLRELLTPVCELHQYTDFVVIDRQGINVAALQNSSIGKREEFEDASFVDRIMAGETIICNPFIANVVLSTQSGETVQRRPVMFVGAPVRGTNGEVIAALCFQVFPENDFSRVFGMSQFGESGESYAFDRQGIMISESRFNADLRSAGLLSELEEASAILCVKITDPGGNLLTGYTPQGTRPLTVMAASAVRGESGLNIDGYRDYRGVEVLGAWEWMEQCNFGIATEVNKDEAYAAYYDVRVAFYITIAFLVLAVLAIVWFDYQNSRRAQMLRESREHLSEALEEVRLLEFALDQHALVSITDLSGKIIRVNDRFCGLSKYSREELLGTTHRIVNSGHHPREFFREMWKALSQGHVWQGEIKNRAKDGEIYWVQTTITPIRNKEGAISQYISIRADITARKKAEEDLLLAKEQAEMANFSKSEFLANMSHEIRTPMNGVLGMTELVLDTPLNADQRDCVKMIQTSADTLLHVINDILDFSKIEAGKMELEETPVSLRRVVSDTLKMLSLRATDKKIKLGSELQEDLIDRVVTDPVRLRQILINLVGNAIKFTDQGHVKLKAHLAAETSEEVLLEFCVQDTGAGIPKNRLETIFEAFSQADTSVTRNYGGTGLGLSISSQLINLMRGRIWVESEQGKGSAFYFTITMKKDHTENNNAGEASAKSAEAALSHARVLLVDDCGTNLLLLHRFFEKWGATTLGVGSGEEAMKALLQAEEKSMPYDLIVTDHLMDDMDGFDLVENVRKIPAMAKTPVLLLTSAYDRQLFTRCKELNISENLTKPIREIDLQCAVLRALNRTVESPVALDTQSKTQEQTGTDQQNQEDVHECPPLHVLLVEDNQINQKVASRILSKQGHTSDIASNGREALEAFETNTYDIVLMDIQMPVMDGLTAVAVIRDREKHSGGHLPVIALTANAMQGDEEKCLAAGMDGYVSKPVKPEALRDAMYRVINREKILSEESPPPQEASDAAPDDSTSWVFDEQAALERVGGDEEFLCELMRDFLRASDAMADELQSSLQDQDTATLRRVAHTLKSNAGTFSADTVQHSALKLEEIAAEENLAEAEPALAQLEEDLRQLQSDLQKCLAQTVTA